MIEGRISSHVESDDVSAVALSSAAFAPRLLVGRSEHKIKAVGDNVYSRSHPKHRVPTRQSFLQTQKEQLTIVSTSARVNKRENKSPPMERRSIYE